MELLARLFPYGKTIAGMRKACDQTQVFKDSSIAQTRRMRSPAFTLAMMTQAAQTVLQSRESPVMPRMAVLLGFMGIGVSGYSSRQLTLHCKPSRHLFR
ncbi:uncharacterized protein zgc:193593 [Synchiropus splendidus]|uniref:uncharacterized protein zgc:193593 n=1 Tax=Synchiropus splendidus TaxID=270530 RepID=UPI00237DAB97|nr:uncharacterized protein zgc:193593 [Synchiropus splendidus]